MENLEPQFFIICLEVHIIYNKCIYYHYMTNIIQFSKVGEKVNRIDCKNRKFVSFGLSNCDNIAVAKNKSKEKQEDAQEYQQEPDGSSAKDLSVKGAGIIDKTNHQQIMKILHPQIKVNYVKCSNLPEEYCKNSVFESMKKKQSNDKKGNADTKQNPREVVLKDMGLLEE